MDPSLFPRGLSTEAAAARLRIDGSNTLETPTRARGLWLFLTQFKSPLVLLLIGAAILSFFLGDALDVLLILAIVLLSGVLGFWQEHGALSRLEKLLRMVETMTSAVRDGREIEVPSTQIVVGDLVVLRAGDLVPADCMIKEATHCFIDESKLTGESLSVEKGTCDQLFLGAQLASGVAYAEVIATGRKTKYSDLIERIRFRPPETASSSFSERLVF